MKDAPPRLRFGPFELQPETGELTRDGRGIRLAPQPAHVLSLIVAAQGRLVSREEVRAAVWADGTTVEFDQGLNYCLRQIRIALKDDARRPTYVETVPKRGYRLLVPVIVDDPVAPQTAVVVSQIDAAAPAPVSRFRPLLLAATVLLGVALVATIALGRRARGSGLEIDAETQRLFVEAEHLSAAWELRQVRDAVTRYKQVIQRQPRFASAWAGLANADVILTFLGSDPAAALADSEVHARRAVELDGSQPTAHAALAHSFWHQWRWLDADREFQRAHALGADQALVHQLYALYLASAGKSDAAIEHARQAVASAPVSVLTNYTLAQVYFHTGHYQEAIAQANRTLEFDRHFPLAFQTLARAYMQVAQGQTALRVLDEEERFVQEEGTNPWRGYVLARQGQREAAREMSRNGRGHGGAVAKASSLEALGDRDGALAVLDEAVTAHTPSLLWLRQVPELSALRSDPRFAALLKRMNWP